MYRRNARPWFPRLKPDALAQAGHRIGAGCRLFAVELTIRLHLVEERPDCLPSRGISRIARKETRARGCRCRG